MQQESDEREILEFLTSSETLSGAAHGIALQVIDKGQESLSAKQAEVFQKIIKPYFELECSRCKIQMPGSEIAFALSEEDGLCSWCRKMSENDD